MIPGKGSVIQGNFLHGLPRPWPAGAPSPAAPGNPRHPSIPHPSIPIQRAASGSAVPWAAGPGFFATGTGQRLPETVQRKMESLFGTRFDDVRIHVGPQPSAIGALAFTHGSDLYFAPGQYDPQTPRGQRLLGHELTHVVQQRTGRARNPFGSGVAVLQDPALEAEAERMGLRAAVPQAPTPSPALQRHPITDLPRTRPAVQLMPRPAATRGVRGVIQRVRENDLQALSMLLTGYQRTAEKSAAGEIQAMYIDSNVVVTSNSASDMQHVAALLTSKKAIGDPAVRINAMHVEALRHQGKKRYSHYDFLYVDSAVHGGAERAGAAEAFIDTHLYQGGDRLLPTLTGVQVASNAAICAGLLDGATNQIILLKSDETLHAEQQLLRVLAYRIRAGNAPAALGLRGVRKPCSECHAVLTAFRLSYHKVYGRDLEHLTRGEGTSAQRLDLKREFPGAGADFGRFVEIYDELLTPADYRCELNGTPSINRAAGIIQEHLGHAELPTAKQILLDGYEANRPGRFRVSRYEDQPISFTGGTGAKKDEYLSQLLTRLSVAHEPPPKEKVETVEEPRIVASSSRRQSSRETGSRRRGGRASVDPPVVADDTGRNGGGGQGADQNRGLPWGWIGTGVTFVAAAAWYNWPAIVSSTSSLFMKEDPASQRPRLIPPPPVRWR
jgi:hypothetical protein